MNHQKKIPLFQKKGFYIALTVVLSLLLAADIALGLLPAGNRQSVTPGGFSQSGGRGGLSGELPDGLEMPENGAMPESMELPEDMTLPSGMEMPEGTGEFSVTAPGGTGLLQGIKRLWIPIAFALALLDGLSVFLLVRLCQKQKVQAQKQQMERLFSDGEVHLVRKKKEKKSSGWAWMAAAAVTAVLGLMVRLLSGASPAAEIPRTQESLISGTVEKGTVSVTLPGSGTLTEETAQTVSLVSGVEIEKWYVSDGDVVTQGDKLASVDRVSVMSAIAKIQDTVELLDEAMAACEDDTIDDVIKSPVEGRVKEVYLEAGAGVADIMYEHGCLLRISLDGLMAVSLNTELSLTPGDSVSVSLEDETELTGRVESVLGGTVVITVSDETLSRGEKVRVTTGDGDLVGSGALYIHSELKVTAWSGTVDKVYAEVNEKISTGDTLAKLSDIDYDGEYETLLSQRQTLEAQMLTLFQLYQEGYLYAEASGAVSGAADQISQSLSADSAGYTLSLLANAPGEDPDASYVNYIGKVTGITDGVWQLAIDPESWDIIDYSLLEQLEIKEETMTQAVSLTPEAATPVYVDTHIGWVAGKTEQVSVGDTLLFAFDPVDTTRLVWVICLDVREAAEQPTVPDETGSTVPSQSQPSGGSGNLSGGTYTPSFGSGSVQEETPISYKVEETQILSITSQQTMEITVTVDELDILSLGVGQTAQVTLDALPGRAFTGSVTQVGASGTTSGGNSKYTAVISIPREENMLPGMNASVSVALSEKQDALTVPVAALTEENGKTYVYTAYDEQTDTLGGRTEVTTGVSDGSQVEILTGLSAGDSYYYKALDTVNYSVSTVQTGGTGGFGFGSFISGRSSRGNG